MKLTDLKNIDNLHDKEERLFSERLKSLIGGRKQSDIAGKWKIAPSTLSAYLNHGSLPNIEIASHIAAVEGVDIAWLIDGNPVSKVLGEIENQKITEIMTEDEFEIFLERLKRNGTSWFLLPESVMKMAVMLNDLPDEHVKEISLLINEAQYHVIMGIPFRITKIHGRKKASG